ncbi:hypothetical protein G6F22_014314 [Rhizopus arrhizus]|nr:hypothetical protein G6F22_014314 [Rhizopus arrhizus]
MAFAFALSAPAWAQDAALELAQARQAVDKATQADADQYAPDLIGLARQGLEQAQRAAGDRRERKNAPAMALRAAADADLARVRSEEATVTAQLQLRRNEPMTAATLAALLALPTLAVAADNPMVAQLSQRLMAIQANPDTAELGAFERMQAQQAIATLDKAKRRDQELATYLAERRVEIAETAVRTAMAAREVDRLERTRSDLLIEASRRDAARARQEAEQLRMQAQMQAEEAERLRQAAEAETLARQDAENALTSVAGKQQQRLSAAQQNAAKLAREEAELVSGQKLPGSKFDGRGEVFTFNGDAFAAGASSLSGGARNQAKALAEYLNIGKKGRLRIAAYANANGVGQKRAEALRDALVAAGVASNRIQVSGKKAASTRARSAEVIIAP